MPPFGSGANIALLIWMGYGIYTKASNAQVVATMRRRVDETTSWTKVGKNAEMATWEEVNITNCLYPLGAEVPSLLHVLLRSQMWAWSALVRGTSSSMRCCCTMEPIE
jgi:hypothetical protein